MRAPEKREEPSNEKGLFPSVNHRRPRGKTSNSVINGWKKPLVNRKGKNSLDGQNGSTKTPRTCSVDILLMTLHTSLIGGTIYLLSNSQDWVNASTPAEEGDQNLELNFATLQFLGLANRSMVNGPHFAHKWLKNCEEVPQSSTSIYL